MSCSNNILSHILSSLLLLCFCRWDNNHNTASATSFSTTIVGSKSKPSNSSSSVSSAIVTNINNEQQIDQHPSSPSTTTTTTAQSSWSNNILQQSFQNQNPYVAASPLSVAAVCNDGIALISLHYNADHEEENEEEEEDEEEGQSTLEKIDTVFRDLPISTRGPLRIEHIYENNNNNNMQSTSTTTTSSYNTNPPPMALLTAGWRTDGLTLCNAARELISDEVRLYCLPALTTTNAMLMTNTNENEGVGGRSESEQENRLIEDSAQSTTNNNNAVSKKEITTQQSQAPQIQHQQKQQQHSSYHGRRIAEGLSYYLSKCQFSSGIRSLSTVGLLACGGSSVGGGGSLYLIDTTGIHQVRAHAIGNGSFNIHRRMVFIDFSTMDCLEGVKVLLRLIAEEGGLVSKQQEEKNDVDDDRITIESSKSNSVVMMKKPAFLSGSKSRRQHLQGKNEKEGEKLSDTLPKWNIPSNTAVELAVLKHGDGRMKRIRLSSLIMQ